MAVYIIRRLVYAVVVALVAVTIMFLLLRLTGDPAQMMVDPQAEMEQVLEVRRKMGFDRPLYVQLGAYIFHAVQGDLGNSFRYGKSAFAIVTERLPATLELATTAMIISLVIAIPAGIISATRRNSWLDHVTMVGALLGQTVPVFWLGIVLIMFFSVRLHWFPTGGRGTLLNLVLPAIALAAFGAARIARLTRSAMLEVMDQDYVRVARSKGLDEKTVIVRHALRNASIPVITMTGLQMGHLLAGAVITETVFAWPGLGRLLVQSISTRDYPVIQAAVLVLAAVIALINLMVDVLYAYVDPRIEYR